MALNFDFILNIETGEQPFISHEKDSTIYRYSVDDEAAIDRSALVTDGGYDQVEYGRRSRHLTTRSVAKIGIKNFPGIGGIGFYKDAYTSESRLLVPIHPDTKFYKAPTLKTVEAVGGRLHIVIEPPADIEYTSYRVIVRQTYFAFEYILYKPEYYVDLPTVQGDYIVYCIGYDEDQGTCSMDSNELPLTITTGHTDWTPHLQEVGDLIYRMDAVDEQLADIQEDIEQFQAGEVTLANWYYVGDTGASTYTRSYKGTKGNMLLLLLLTRGNLTTPPAGWTKLGSLVESQDKQNGTVTYDQYVHIFCKECAGTENFTYTQTQTDRSVTCVIEFEGADTPVIAEYTRQENIASETAFTFARTSQDYFVWIINTVFFLTDTYTWNVSDANVTQLPNNGTDQPRLGVFLDDRATNDPFTVSSDMTGRYCSGIGIQIPVASLANQVEDLKNQVTVLEQSLDGVEDLQERVTVLEQSLDGVEALVDEINGEVI